MVTQQQSISNKYRGVSAPSMAHWGYCDRPYEDVVKFVETAQRNYHLINVYAGFVWANETSILYRLKTLEQITRRRDVKLYVTVHSHSNPRYAIKNVKQYNNDINLRIAMNLIEIGSFCEKIVNEVGNIQVIELSDNWPILSDTRGIDRIFNTMQNVVYKIKKINRDIIISPGKIPAALSLAAPIFDAIRYSRDNYNEQRIIQFSDFEPRDYRYLWIDTSAKL